MKRFDAWIDGRCCRLWLVVLLLAVGCGSTPDGDAPPSDRTGGQGAASIDGYDLFGAAFSADGAVDLARIIADPEAHLGRPVKVTATISEVCQMSGCWMSLDVGSASSGDAAAGDDIIIQFKDYGFFVPKDCAGRDVVVAGELQRVERSVDELRHLAEDAGRTEAEIAAITEPEMAWRIEATGVLIREPADADL